MKLINSAYKIKFLNREYSQEEYLKYSFGISILITIVLATYSIDYIILFPLIIYLFIIYAKKQYYEKIGNIEKKLPLFLEMVALKHKIGIPLNVILDNLKDEFEELINFKLIYSKFGKDSEYISRAYYIFNSLIHTGTGEDEILEFCNEISKDMELKIKEYNKKITMMATLFIGSGAILPGLLQAYYLIGSKFMEVSLTQKQIFMIFVFLFPLINGGLLWYINQKKPRFY